jgi:hypothetical protein
VRPADKEETVKPMTVIRFWVLVLLNILAVSTVLKFPKSESKVFYIFLFSTKGDQFCSNQETFFAKNRYRIHLEILKHDKSIMAKPVRDNQRIWFVLYDSFGITCKSNNVKNESPIQPKIKQLVC